MESKHTFSPTLGNTNAPPVLLLSPKNATDRRLRSNGHPTVFKEESMKERCPSTSLHLKRTHIFVASVFAALSLLIAAVIAAPCPALAAQTNEPIVIDDPTKNTSGDGWEWVSAGSSGTLTLNKLDLKISADKNQSAIVVPDGATIHLVGENTITTNVASTSAGEYAGIEAQGDVTFTGENDSALEIIATGSSTYGIDCAGDLNIDTVELNTSAQGTNSIGIFASGNTVINNNAILAAMGTTYGLKTNENLNITDALLVKFGVETPSTDDAASAFIAGETLITDVSDEKGGIVISGEKMKMQGSATISNTTLTTEEMATADGALLAENGLEIIGSDIDVQSSGCTVHVDGKLTVENSTLRSESYGNKSIAMHAIGNTTFENSKIYALGDDTAEKTRGISINPDEQGTNGTLTLIGNPSITAEGSECALAFWSSDEQWESDPLILDPTIGVTEGGMLSYAENTTTSDFVSAWTYSTGEPNKLSINDNGELENASNHVVIEVEKTLLFITDEGIPLTGLTSIKAIAADGTEYEAEEWLDGSHEGYYRFPKALPDGNYTIEMESAYETSSALLTVGDNAAAIYPLDFCTIEIQQSNHSSTWFVQPSTGESVTAIENILVGSTVELKTQTDKGYSFATYSAAQQEPLWENDDKTLPEQTITIQGSTVITPSVKALNTTNPTNDSTGTDTKSHLAKTGDVVSPELIALLAALTVLCAGVLITALRKRR